jgi:hypothetical protein
MFEASFSGILTNRPKYKQFFHVSLAYAIRDHAFEHFRSRSWSRRCSFCRRPTGISVCPRLRNAGRGSPRLSRNVPSPSSSVWNRLRRCSSGISHSKNLNRGIGQERGHQVPPVTARVISVQVGNPRPQVLAGTGGPPLGNHPGSGEQDSAARLPRTPRDDGSACAASTRQNTVRLPCADESIVLPTVPQTENDIDEFLRAAIAQVVLHMRVADVTICLLNRIEAPRPGAAAPCAV